MRRLVLLAALSTSSLATGPIRSAGAQDTGPIVSVSATPASVISSTSCDGGPPRPTPGTPGAITVERTGDLAAPLEVQVDWTGPLVDDPSVAPLPDPIVIAAGERATEIVLPPSEPGESLTATLRPGAGYDLGAPDSATFATVTGVGDPACIFDPGIVQTIAVGSTPDPVDAGRLASVPPDAAMRILWGQIPPGLTYRADGTWEGLATEVGEFASFVVYCEVDGFCPTGWRITITVVAATTPPSGPPPAPPASPAEPVRGQASFTG